MEASATNPARDWSGCLLIIEDEEPKVTGGGAAGSMGLWLGNVVHVGSVAVEKDTVDVVTGGRLVVTGGEIVSWASLPGV